MKNTKQNGKRIVVAAAALALVGAVAACGGKSVGNAGQAGSSPSHGGHGQFVPPSPAPLRAGERFVTLTMEQPYSPSAPNGGTDEYRCFLVDPKLTTKGFLTGSQFLPQNVDIVHHAIFFAIGPGEVAKAREADERAQGEGWQCFSGTGIEDGDDAWVAHWAPGANEVLLREGLGYELAPGSQLVMQVHYNILAVKGKDSTDRSSIRLRVAENAAITPLHTLQLPAPIELPCTAQESGPLCDRAAAIADVTKRFGEDVGQTAGQLSQWCSGGKVVAGTTQHCDHPVDSEATIYAAAGHMHLLGRSIKIEVNPGTAGANTVLDLPQYNFDEQAIRPLATPVKVNKGDVVRVTCTHDAGLRAMLPQLQQLPPRYVVWGDGTSDEMCLGLLMATVS